MSWRDPNPFEQTLLADTRSRWPEIIALARCLTLAPRIEPLLLRNARRRFVPQAQAEVESLLWFSPLVAARSTREIVLHLGVAKALADEIKKDAPEDLETMWQFTRRLTRHWDAEDRLERDLRYYTLLDDGDQLKLGLRDILRHIRAEDDEGRRIALCRLAKRTLPIIAAQGPTLSQAPSEARVLAQYAALALGDAGSWAQPGDPQVLPDWLVARLPAPRGSAELGVEIRHDTQHGQVLHLVAAGATTVAERIAFPSPLPARLHVAGEGRTGAWHTVTQGSRIRISAASPSVRLTTLDGRQWDLRTEALPGGESVKERIPAPLILAHVEADWEQARAIGEWLRGQGVPVQLLADSARPTSGGESPSEARVVRLWTRAARAFWAGRFMEQAQAVARGLVLRTEPVDPPATGVGLGRVLDWQDWSALDASPRAERLLRDLQRWRDSGEIEPEPFGRADKVLSTLKVLNSELSEDERAVKYYRMGVSPTVFYRGTNHLFWADFAGDKRLTLFGNAKTRTWLQGDLHVFSFGSYDNSRGEVVYDLNDFDEAIYADYQYDLWRMAVSIVLVARQNDDLAISQLGKVVDAFSQTYLDTLTSYRKEKSAKKIYFTQENSFGNLERFLKDVGQQYRRKAMLDKWAPMDKTAGRRFDVKGRPDKLAKATDEQCKVILEAMAAYRNALNNDHAKHDAYFKVKDIARRIGAGTPSLGTPRFYVLIEAGNPGNPDDDRILDVKQQSRPTPYDYLDKESKLEYDRDYEQNHAWRHAIAYQALTYRTDPHLGWMYLERIKVRVGDDVRDWSGYYSVRERSPFKEVFPVEVLDTRPAFTAMAEQWAEVLATDHARANTALPGAVYALTDDKGEAFLDLVHEIAFTYADQVQADWESFKTVLTS